jgi:transketolase
MDAAELARKSLDYRKTILTIIKHAGAGHTGGSLSCIDILNVLYNRVLNVSPAAVASPDRDRYVHSKGHSVEALYTVLADRGFFPASELATLCREGSHFVGHPTRKVPGIEQNTGALGHGLSVAVGMALAAKLDGRTYRVFTTMGDGELSEGSVWEAAMSAAHYKLDNLVAIVDRNRLQITGRTEEVMGLDPLEARFEAFGFAVRTVDGNDVAALAALFAQLPFAEGKPNLVLAHTVKGKGISFIEDKAKWHHHVPTDGELAAALAELDSTAPGDAAQGDAAHAAAAR